MCLTTKDFIKIAECDIRVYKAVKSHSDGRWSGIYDFNNKRFAFNEVVRNDEPMDVKNQGIYTEVYGGFFHSCREYTGPNQHVFYSGFGRRVDYEMLTLECTIPAGTEYYYDSELGEYASRSIIVHSDRRIKKYRKDGQGWWY